MELTKKEPRQHLLQVLFESGMVCTESFEYVASEINSIGGIILAGLFRAQYKLPDTSQFNI